MNEPTATPQPDSGRRNPFHRGPRADEVQSVTDAAQAHSDEMRSRMVKYGTAMGIRMVCIVLIFVVDGWWKLVPVVGAVLLPWIAVVIANAGADTSHLGAATQVGPALPGELPAPAAPTGSAEPIILTGDFLVHDDTPPPPTAPPKEDPGHEHFRSA